MLLIAPATARNTEADALGAEGRRFESCLPDHQSKGLGRARAWGVTLQTGRALGAGIPVGASFLEAVFPTVPDVSRGGCCGLFLAIS